MQIFNINNKKIRSLKEIPFKLEREIQELFEANLEILTGWQKVKTEFVIKANRIDTLAFDVENNAFVIIEYKRERNYSVVDQGVAYLSLLLEYKADFLVEYNESQHKSLKRSDIDWTQTKVVFVAPSFTDFQKQASNFKDLPIELLEIKQFESNILSINSVKKSKESPSIKEVQSKNNTELAKITKEVVVYTEDRHLSNKSEDIEELYLSYKQAILNLSNSIDLEAKKWYIAFKIDNRNIVDIEIQKTKLKMWINLRKGELNDSKGLTRDVADLGHAGNGDYEVFVSDTVELEYIMSLVKQAI